MLYACRIIQCKQIHAKAKSETESDSRLVTLLIKTNWFPEQTSQCYMRVESFNANKSMRKFEVRQRATLA